jgi:hypothetical protein
MTWLALSVIVGPGGRNGDGDRIHSGRSVADSSDVSAFVAEQRGLLAEGRMGELFTPAEQVYPIGDAEFAPRLGIGESHGAA